MRVSSLKSILFLITFLLLGSSCQKVIIHKDDPAHQFLGKWEVYRYIGFRGGGLIHPIGFDHYTADGRMTTYYYDPTNGTDEYLFKVDSSSLLDLPSVLHLTLKRDIGDYKAEWRYTFVSSDTLILSAIALKGVTRFYRKIGD